MENAPFIALAGVVAATVLGLPATDPPQYGSAPRPHPDAPRPRPDASQPRPDASQPRPDASRPRPDAPRPRPDAPQSQLTLSYLADAGFATAVKITCEPAGGGHPEATEACATLARTGADPSRITPGTQACILVYAPIRAELTGTWRGRPVTWSQRYGNACEMRRATGPLFRF